MTIRTCFLSWLAVCCLVVHSHADASQKLKAITIAVLDGRDENGFVEPKAIDSIRDIQRELKGCSFLRVVPVTAKDSSSRSDDDIPRMNISVSRTIEKTAGSEPTYYEALHAYIGVIPEFPKIGNDPPAAKPFFKLIYKVGGAGRWRYAAKEIVKELCDWTEANLAQFK